MHENGFYVFAKPSLADPRTVTQYIGRYLGRPVIATKRIDRYNKDADTVTFHYNRHEDNKYIERTLPANHRSIIYFRRKCFIHFVCNIA